MDFLQRDVRNLFCKEFPYTETKPKDEPPAKYNAGADVRDSIAGSGAIINGVVERAVLFRKVYTSEHSSVRNAILMDGCHIGIGCVVQHAILDKEVVLSDGKQIIGKPDSPIIVTKRTVL